MQVSEASINVVFSKGILKIPYFQRSYVWNDKNWEKFYNDIAEIAMALSNNEQPENYFMGSIIIKKSEEGGQPQFDVIDGQQRLSTIVLFMKALCLSQDRDRLFHRNYMELAFNGESKPILIPNHNDRPTYMSLITSEVLHTDAINNTNMANAYAYFARRIMESNNGIDIDYPVSSSFLYSAVNYVRLVCVELENKENAQKIFETINCTGIKLTTGEMLKNYLYDENRTELYENTWRRVFEADSDTANYWNEAIIKGRIEDCHINNFFYRYMLVKMQEPEIRKNLTQAEMKSYRKQEGLFEKFKSLIENNNLTADVVIDDVVQYANLYKETFKKDVLDEAIPGSAGIERLICLMYALNSWTMTPYIMYILRNQNDEAERRRIFGYIETYLIRRVFCRSQNNNYSDMFSENLIGQRVNTFDGFKQYVNNAEDRGALLMPSDNDVRNAILNTDQKRNASVLLYMMESKMNESFSSNENDEENDREYTNGYLSFVTEQVMPEKNNDSWAKGNYSEEDRERLTRTIGNFILLRDKLKGSERKADWAAKKRAMLQRIKDVRTSSIINEMNRQSWSESTIEDRNNSIADSVIGLWPLY